MNNTIQNIKNNSAVKVVFTDLFDTLIHRGVHPNYVYRIWAKFLIRELGLTIDINALFKIRANATTKLASDMKLNKVEVPYEFVMKEVYKRLVNSDNLNGVEWSTFQKISKESDYRSETSVQYINTSLVEGLKTLKSENYKIFIVSDYHLSKDVIMRLLEFHGISSIFNDVFISCDLKKSKESDGSLYPFVLEKTGSLAEHTAMMGDNKISDVINSSKHGLHGYFLKHYSHKFRNKKNLFGSEEKEFNKACKEIEQNCRKSDFPFSEYIIHFYFFTERLYTEAKRKGIKDLFFLAREGHYLKQLFDTYQKFNGLNDEDYIKTHYFKASRHSAKQVSLKPIEEEKFAPIKKNYDVMTTGQFLSSFNLNEDSILNIANELDIDKDLEIENFSTSSVLLKLKNNKNFSVAYESHRIGQRNAFNNYLNSFNVDFKSDGMVLVDVGWGGTMQECIYEYLGGNVPVTGYYIGLREIYNIKDKTRRYGLNFSVYPKKGYSDYILQANGQLYEQLLAAPHGSTLGYNGDPSSPTIEYHEPNEKRVFDEFISSIQNFMDGQFDELCNGLNGLSYTEIMVQDYLTAMALRLGLFTNRKKLKFIQLISRGFYQNVGGNKVGMVYDPSQLSQTKAQLVKEFLWSPEKTFRYIVKLKPLLYDKKLAWLGWMVSSTYYYIKVNRSIKKRIFSKDLIT
ncbi:HAD hydrolase-like protein [Maribacter stanieri]|uniref:Haloacid dehalogenase-like hydrolase n=1 Tax=Maribacter stanieri TaxID=440514 RepID=A0A1I6JSF9_9FLAO|nr:HAD hydrolase-like protein [Maribacter stanieri]SFR81919.1 Haloacid dehalogenase-like hydrolase [Maribacter stanieri]